MKGLFITFEGTEGSGKSTQIGLLADRCRALGFHVQTLREPGGTPIGEEIRHTLKHSEANRAMTAKTELLLMNASRAQLVGEVICPALARGEIILCDRFYDSTTAYQGYGRGIDLCEVRQAIDLAVGETRPDLTLLLMVPVAVSESRRRSRQLLLPALPNAAPNAAAAPSLPLRDRMEEADRAFFERVEGGYKEIAAAEPARIRTLDATQSVEKVAEAIWAAVNPSLLSLKKDKSSR